MRSIAIFGRSIARSHDDLEFMELFAQLPCGDAESIYEGSISVCMPYLNFEAFAICLRLFNTDSIARNWLSELECG